MTSHPGTPWPAQGHQHADPQNPYAADHPYAHHHHQHHSRTHPPPPPSHHHHPHHPHPPHASSSHHAPYYHPSASSPPPSHHSYYSYPASYPPPYGPHGHPHLPPPPPHTYGHGHAAQPEYTPHNNANNNSETVSTSLDAATQGSKATAAAAPAKTPKAKPGPKTKVTKTQQKQQNSASSSSEATGKSALPKPPKTFRFEGSISSESFKTTKSFDLAGVNILNRKPLDTKTALDKLQRRRETHNRVERKRRDCINQLIDDLTQLLPSKHLEEATSKCHRVNVLRGAVSHIKFLNESNEALTSSFRSIKGDDAPLPVHPQGSKASIADMDTPDREMSMDVDNDDERQVKEEDMDEDSLSRSTSPVGSSPSVSTKLSSSSTSSRKLVPPPVIITDAPSSSSNVTEPANAFGLESRPRSNSFTSSIGDQASPRSVCSTSPMFPPSPISPLPFGRHSLFPPGEENVDVDRDHQRQQLSPFMSHSPLTSPSLPPISSLANLQLQSPSGHMNAPAAGENSTLPSIGSSPGSSFSGRPHRGGTTLPPLMIPEPHHLHPSYQQGGVGGTSGSNGNGGNGSKSGSNSNRSSLTLSPHPTDQPPISPFMLSPMLSRSPSMGPISSSSPGASPYPNWGQDGTPSPRGFSFASPQAHPYGYQGGPSEQNGGSQNSSSSSGTRPKSLQPEPIFIQEEPWNTQRKRSSSNVSGKAPSTTSNSLSKKREDGENAEMVAGGPISPTSSITSTMSYPASPNPKKRAQLASYDEDEDDETAKRSKQIEHEILMEQQHQGDSGVVVVVDAPESDRKAEDAAQALTSLART